MSVLWHIYPRRRAFWNIARLQHYRLQADPERHICVTCGVTEAIAAALLAVVDPGDEVIVIEPFHENFVAAIAFADGRPLIVSLAAPDYRLDGDRLRAVFSARTAAILVNTPHNPTGRVFTRSELEMIAALCQQFDVVAITDEIYEHIIYEGREHVSLAVLPGMAQRTITCAGLSKTFAVTGWRLGYVVATDDALSQAVRTVHDYTTICAPTPLQHAAVVALGLPDSYYAALAAGYQQRRNFWLAVLAEVGFRAAAPEGAYYVMADFGDLGFAGDSRAAFSADRSLDYQFGEWLAREAGLAVVPGSSFYLTPGLGETSVRFAFPKRLETLQEAARRLGGVGRRLRR